tara:strand:+ start:622 stop:1461 length:840 start_codon:yes stop_codon:yes gene_type:complete
LGKFSISLLFITNINKYLIVKIKKDKNKKLDLVPVKWDELNKQLKDKFLMFGDAGLTENYKSDDISGTQLIYSKKLIDKLIKLAKINTQFYYGETDYHLYECLKKYDLQGRDVAILGSTIPWYESIVLSRGGRPVTIEYNEIECDDDRLKTYTNQNFYNIEKKFDFVISISSFEHDGLGRYGDPINPNGDLEAMDDVYNRFLNKNGILFLSVPIGKDTIVWNLHRIYGNKRLPLLFENFELIDSSGFDETLFHREDTYGQLSSQYNSDKPFQPIFVLKK